MFRNSKFYSFLSIWGIFYTIVSSIWLYRQTNDHYKENHFIYLSFCLVISVIIFYLKEFYNYRKIKNSKYYKIKQSLFEIDNLVDKFNSKNNHYSLSLMNLRLGIELTKFKLINGSVWELKALQKYAYLRSVFGAIISELDEGDEYRTLSNVDFWMKDRYGGTKFLTKNINASNRGVKIKRIIIIDENLFIRPLDYTKEINALKSLVDELCEMSNSNNHKMRNLETYFYPIKKDSEDIESDIPFAVIQNIKTKKYMSILPQNLKDKDEQALDNKKEPSNDNSKQPSIIVKLKSPGNDTEVEHAISDFEKISNRKTELLTKEVLKEKLKNLI